MNRVRLELLGGFRLISGSGRGVDIPAKKNRALIGILAMAPRGEVTRDRLAGLLWSNRGEEQARNSLRQALVSLRKDFTILNADPLVLSGDRVGLDPKLVSVDVVEFLAASASEDATELQQAADLYAGPFLDGLNTVDNAFEEWLREARADLVSRAIRVLESLAGTLAGDERLAAAERLVALDPLREASHHALIEAYVAKGERPLAIKQYEACTLILKRELGVSPGAELQELRRSLDANDLKPSASLHRDRKPVIAVLPFRNMSGDPDQRYFSDGITEDIITELSRFRTLSVIARNSSFQYRDEAVDVRRVANELGVQYLVEGSVRKLENRIRITAQLIDAVTGNHLWSERYDRTTDALFELQDEVTKTIVATMTSRVEDAEIAGSVRKRTDNLAAYDRLLRGIDHLRSYGADENRLARELFEEAVNLDPRFALAHAYLSIALLLEHDFDNAPQSIKDQAFDLALKSVRLDPSDSRCHQFLAAAYLLRGDFDVAISHFERMASLNPNDANGITNLGYALAAVGRAQEGVEKIREAMRLNPFHPDWYWGDLGIVLYDARRYEEAAEAFKQVASRKQYWLLARLAACYGQLRRADDAEAQAREVLRLKPEFRISKERLYYKDPADAEHWFEGMRKAGLPD